MIPAKLNKTIDYVIPTKEAVLELCRRFDFNVEDLPSNHKDEPWEKKYPIYVRAITGLDPCPVCNGPVKVVSAKTMKEIRLFKLFQPAAHCIDHLIHTTAIAIVIRSIRRDIQKGLLAIQDKSDPKIYPHGNWHWIESLKDLPDTPEFQDLVTESLHHILGKVCEHGHFLADCKECIEALKQANEERIAIDYVVEMAKETL